MLPLKNDTYGYMKYYYDRQKLREMEKPSMLGRDFGGKAYAIEQRAIHFR